MSGSSPDDSNFRPTTSTTAYDGWGRTLSVTEHTTYSSPIDDRVRYFGNDAAGEILSRRDGTIDHTSGAFTQTDAGAQTSHNYFVDGQQVAVLKENGEINVANLLTGYDAGGTDGYVVQSGDTLAGIAQKVYGNESLWYVIADANALESDSDLVVGAQIKLPQVAVNSNDAHTFKPYNPAESIGSQTPALPYIAPPPSQHCSQLAMIVAIAVMVVLTVVTAGAAAIAAGATEGSLLAAGGAVLTGTSSLGLAASAGLAALGGFVGSVGSQLTGDALGVSKGFSFKQALASGLGAGITAGLGGVVSGGQSIKTLRDAEQFSGYARIAGVGASGAVGNYAGAKLAGTEAHFSWANVAASAIGTTATAALDLPTSYEQSTGNGVGDFFEDAAGGIVNGAIGKKVGDALGASTPSWENIGEDAFGNALANTALHAGEGWLDKEEAQIRAWRAEGASVPNVPLDPSALNLPPAGRVEVQDVVPNHVDLVTSSVPVESRAPAQSGGTGNVVDESDPRIQNATDLAGWVVTPQGAYMRQGPTSADEAQWAKNYDMARESAQATRDYVAMQWKRSQETLAAQAYEARMAEFNRRDSAAALETMGAVPIAGALVLGKTVYGLGTLAIDAASLGVRPTAEALGVDLPYVSDIGQALHNGASGWDVTKAIFGGIVGTPGRMIDDFRQGDVVGSTEELLNLGALATGVAGLAKGGVAALGDLRVGARLVEGGVANSELRTFTYNAVENPGPLANLPNTPAANFFGGRYNSTVLTDDLVLYRGGKAGEPLGQWFTREAPESVAQIRIGSAVKAQWIDPKTGILTGSSPIDNLYAIKIPKGTTIYEGPVGYQGGVYLGGPNTNQVFVQTPWKIPGVQELWARPIK